MNLEAYLSGNDLKTFVIAFKLKQKQVVVGISPLIPYCLLPPAPLE